MKFLWYVVLWRTRSYRVSVSKQLTVKSVLTTHFDSLPLLVYLFTVYRKATRKNIASNIKPYKNCISLKAHTFSYSLLRSKLVPWKNTTPICKSLQICSRKKCDFISRNTLLINIRIYYGFAPTLFTKRANSTFYIWKILSVCIIDPPRIRTTIFYRKFH